MKTTILLKAIFTLLIPGAVSQVDGQKAVAHFKIMDENGRGFCGTDIIDLPLIDDFHGVVEDRDGNRLIGAAIYSEDLKFGTITDTSGEYSFSLHSDELKKYDSLLISYTGFNTKKVHVKDLLGDAKIMLEEIIVDLPGVVVTAYSKSYNCILRDQLLCIHILPDTTFHRRTKENKEEKKSFFSTCPNPFSSDININFTLTQQSDIAIHLVDMNGKVFYKTIRSFESGENIATIQPLDIPPGMYIVQLQIPGHHDDEKPMAISQPILKAGSK